MLSERGEPIRGPKRSMAAGGIPKLGEVQAVRNVIQYRRVFSSSIPKRLAFGPSSGKQRLEPAIAPHHLAIVLD
jgi:hypothetical protein